jgi:hypothetical protein
MMASFENGNPVRRRNTLQASEFRPCAKFFTTLNVAVQGRRSFLLAILHRVASSRGNGRGNCIEAARLDAQTADVEAKRESS